MRVLTHCMIQLDPEQVEVNPVGVKPIKLVGLDPLSGNRDLAVGVKNKEIESSISRGLRTRTRFSCRPSNPFRGYCWTARSRFSSAGSGRNGAEFGFRRYWKTGNYRFRLADRSPLTRNRTELTKLTELVGTTFRIQSIYRFCTQP